MNHLIITITFTFILGIVSGAPLLTCDKIQGVQEENFTTRYKVTLENCRDAEDVIEIVEKHQMSLNMTDSSEIISKLEQSRLGNELIGNLSKQALHLVSYVT